jgi:hypothetical protein
MPVGYEFTGAPADQFDDFLIICGEILLSDSRTWTFKDPALTAREATLLAPWLRGVAVGSVQPTSLPHSPTDEWDEGSILGFVEPVLAFSVIDYEPEQVALRVHLMIETLPPWVNNSSQYDFYIVLIISPEGLLAAADEWERELDSFPRRTND